MQEDRSGRENGGEIELRVSEEKKRIDTEVGRERGVVGRRG